MKIDIVPIQGIPTRVLIVEESDPSFPCENCGKPSYSHELLAKEDKEWCMDCNDNHFKGDWSDERMLRWSIEQLIDGKAILVVTRGD